MVNLNNFLLFKNHVKSYFVDLIQKMCSKLSLLVLLTILALSNGRGISLNRGTMPFTYELDKSIKNLILGKKLKSISKLRKIKEDEDRSRQIELNDFRKNLEAQVKLPPFLKDFMSMRFL